MPDPGLPPFELGDIWGGGGGGGGGGGATGPFIPTFSQTGVAPDFVRNFSPANFSQMNRRRLPGVLSAGPGSGWSGGPGPIQGWTFPGAQIPGIPGGGGTQPPQPPGSQYTPPNVLPPPPGIGGGGPGGGIGLPPVGPPTPGLPRPPGPSQGPAQPGGGPSTENPSIYQIIGALIKNGFLGGNAPGYGGAYGLNPPAELMSAIRSRAVEDAGAQERAARLGLQGRSDIDPSTYGFQALQSQIAGQGNVANTLGNADLQLRSQQLQNYWNLLNALLGSRTSSDNALIGANGQPGGGGWGGFLQGLGGLAGGIGSLF